MKINKLHMKKSLSFFSLLLMAAVQSWAVLPTPEVVYVQLYENGPKWANMNLGARSVTDVGKYFWWGDVVGRAKGETYNFSDDNPAIDSYGNDGGYVADGILVAEKDAATERLGAGYRMPTLADFEDLCNKCDWTWTENYNGVENANGYVVTGRSGYSDESIFIPASGYFDGDDLRFEDRGHYWSSSTGDANHAYFLWFNSDTYVPDAYDSRYLGSPIRPVYEDPAQVAYNAYDYLVSLIGEKEYVYGPFKIYADEGDIKCFTGDDTFTCSKNDISVWGNEYLLTESNVMFVVEDGEIAHVYVVNGNGEVSFEFTEAGGTGLEADLAELMGDDVFVSPIGMEFFAKDGQLWIYVGMEMNQTIPMSYLGVLTMIEGVYVYQMQGEGNMIFIVEDGKVEHIVVTGPDMEEYDYICEKKEPIAVINDGENEIAMASVERFIEAYSDIEGTATVRLLGDITLPEGEYIRNNNAAADITLDLNGHNLLGNYVNNAIIYASNGKLTIVGDGTVENIGEDGDAIDCWGTVAINGGTYVVSEICYVNNELTINGGKFKTSVLYFEDDDYTRPIIKGGLFSIDPSDCVAEGYEVVDNDDEATMAEYPYKVVEASSTPTAIESINADKSQKALKTLENGKVVIIRGEKKFDLTGREL